jgi:hypothetical protein
MRLKRFDTAADASGAGDAVLFATIGDGESDGGGPLAWPKEPGALIDDVLLFHRVPAALAERLLTVAAAAGAKEISDDPLRDLDAALTKCLSFSSFPALWRGGSLALVGPPGIGKTTLAGKIASRARLSRPMLVNTDAARVGVPAQLAEYSGVLSASRWAARARPRRSPPRRRASAAESSSIRQESTRSTGMRSTPSPPSSARPGRNPSSSCRPMSSPTRRRRSPARCARCRSAACW